MSDFEVRDGGFLYFQGRLCVPALKDLRDRILREAHRSPFFVHPGSNKMYQDLRPFFWWPCMKRDVSEFVSSVSAGEDGTSGSFRFASAYPDSTVEVGSCDHGLCHRVTDEVEQT